MNCHERISAQVIHPIVGLRKLSTNLRRQFAQPTGYEGNLPNLPAFVGWR